MTNQQRIAWAEALKLKAYFEGYLKGCNDMHMTPKERRGKSVAAAEHHLAQARCELAELENDIFGK